jgi:hypothetical protein
MALEKTTSEFGESHPLTASLLGYLARTYIAQNEKSEFAASLLERQLYMYENEPSLQSMLPERSTCLMEFESLLRSLGRVDEANEVSCSCCSSFFPFNLKLWHNINIAAHFITRTHTCIFL